MKVVLRMVGGPYDGVDVPAEATELDVWHRDVPPLYVFLGLPFHHEYETVRLGLEPNVKETPRVVYNAFSAFKNPKPEVDLLVLYRYTGPGMEMVS